MTAMHIGFVYALILFGCFSYGYGNGDIAGNITNQEAEKAKNFSPMDKSDSSQKKDYLSYHDKKSLNILIITWRGSTDAERGFFDRLKNMNYDAKCINFDAGQSVNSLIKFLSKKFTTNGIDYVYTFGTQASLLVADKLKNSVPQIFNVVSFPEKCGLVNDNHSHNGGNLSGIKSSASIDAQISNAMEFLKFKKLGVLVSTKEQNCLDSYSQIVESAKKFGFEVQQIDINKKKDLQSTISKIKMARDKYSMDALFITAGSIFVSNIKDIVSVANELKIPSIAEIEKMVADGALFGTVSNYYMAGKIAADILYINQFGIPMDQIPVQKCPTYKCINKRTLKALGLPCNVCCEVSYDDDK
ncbi:MAG: hypothetical protein LBH49_03960 [Puniceicoccales bacterium]|jgi:ABC-type uncharacterized transport system substrate-binding protein|nr:hypothetical protein [Puniceicoccales bacterium]